MDNAERRLELIQMMRNEYRENKGRMQKRERILYPNHKTTSELSIDSVSRGDNIGFYIRLGISIGLFLLFFYMDMNNTSYFGINCNMVINSISETIDLKSFAFMQ